MNKTGFIHRVGSTLVEGWMGKSVVVFKLCGGSEIFAVASDLRPEIPLLRDRDKVSITYLPPAETGADGRHDNTVPKNTLKVLSIRIRHLDGSL